MVALLVAGVDVMADKAVVDGGNTLPSHEQPKALLPLPTMSHHDKQVDLLLLCG